LNAWIPVYALLQYPVGHRCGTIAGEVLGRATVTRALRIVRGGRMAVTVLVLVFSSEGVHTVPSFFRASMMQVKLSDP
jgi:hypothetical protein